MRDRTGINHAARELSSDGPKLQKLSSNRLLGHELTHVVQQTSGTRMGRKVLEEALGSKAILYPLSAPLDDKNASRVAQVFQNNQTNLEFLK